VVIALDAGALIALERDDLEMWDRLRVASGAGLRVLVPMAALAQVWRGGPRQALLVRALQLCELVSFDDLAHASGVLCGESATTDVVDASVALTAVRQRATVVCSSDPEDLAHLLDALGADGVKVIAC
jgi:hypothetical protein